MLWASDALNESGKPSVLLLGASLAGESIRACNAFVERTLTEGERLPGTLHLSEEDSMRVTVEVIGEWPEPTPFTLAHPIPETPTVALQLTEIGWRIVLPAWEVF